MIRLQIHLRTHLPDLHQSNTTGGPTFETKVRLELGAYIDPILSTTPAEQIPLHPPWPQAQGCLRMAPLEEVHEPPLTGGPGIYAIQIEVGNCGVFGNRGACGLVNGG